jgi:hypothetical protein
MAVGARIVLGPIGVAFAPVSIGAAAESDAEPDFGIHQPGKDEFRLFAIVGRHGEIVVLHAREFAERPLEGVETSEEGNYARHEPQQLPETHDSRVAFSAKGGGMQKKGQR